MLINFKSEYGMDVINVGDDAEFSVIRNLDFAIEDGVYYPYHLVYEEIVLLKGSLDQCREIQKELVLSLCRGNSSFNTAPMQNFIDSGLE